MSNLRECIQSSKRVVIKVGTSTLTHDNGSANFNRIEKLAHIISEMVDEGREIVLVTSGAIGIGVGKLNLKEKPRTIREKQAVAAVGQCELMHIYSNLFSKYNHIVGQMLLTRDVIEEETRRQNVVNTFDSLMEKGIIPIVNENDSVSVDEIKFGDNDTLSAIVAELTKADLLIILSDIQGLYDSDPKKNPEAKMISVVESITPEIEKSAGGAGTKRGTGGMATKLSAAKIATSAGINMIIANGNNPEIIKDILDAKDVGSLFVSNKLHER